MKKVLIIEDEVEGIIDISFKFVNDYYFQNELKYFYINLSQNIIYDELSSYDIIFLDITLSGSEMDGFGILKKIEKENIPFKRIIILTGNSKIASTLVNRGIKGKYEVLTKPIDFAKLKRFLSD